MYAFIDYNRGCYPIELMARTLKIAPRSYYHYRLGRMALRSQRREAIEKLIQREYATAKGRYGSPRLAVEISTKYNYISARTIAKYMTAMGLRSKLCRRFKNANRVQYSLRIAPNHLNREFEVDAPCKVWVSDITYIDTMHGFRYLTTVIDLYDRKVIGWALSSTMTAQATSVAAYKVAVKSRKPQPGMLFHSDQGVQYACSEFRNALDASIIQSMSRRGNCWDNAVAESFFKSLKCELIYGDKLMTEKELGIKMFEYIELFYNKSRRHSALKNMSIEEFWNNMKSVA